MLQGDPAQHLCGGEAQPDVQITPFYDSKVRIADLRTSRSERLLSAHSVEKGHAACAESGVPIGRDRF